MKRQSHLDSSIPGRAESKQWYHFVKTRLKSDWATRFFKLLYYFSQQEIKKKKPQELQKNVLAYSNYIAFFTQVIIII